MPVRIATTAEDYAAAAALIEAYFLSWGLEDVAEDPDLVEELDGLHDYRPPHGSVLVAFTESGEPAGVVALKRVEDGLCEMKRMYVPPAFRRHGIGRELVGAVIRRAVELGYLRMRLDTPDDNRPALTMYEAFGFTPIESYLDPDHGHTHDDWAWLGLELPRS